MSGGSSVEKLTVGAGGNAGPEVWYDLNDRRVAKESANSGLYIVKNYNSVTKILAR